MSKPTALPKEVRLEDYAFTAGDNGIVAVTKQSIHDGNSFENQIPIREFIGTLLTQAHQDTEQAVKAERARIYQLATEKPAWQPWSDFIEEQLAPSEQKE